MQDVLPGELSTSAPAGVFCHQESMICSRQGVFFAAVNSATDDELHGCPEFWDALILLCLKSFAIQHR